MKWWKWGVLALAVGVVGLVSFLAYRANAKRRDFKETLSWMDQTYNPHEGGDNLGQGHGWEIHYLKKGNVEEITEKFNTTVTLNGGCNIVTRSETVPVGIFSEMYSVTNYKINLRVIDPDAIEIKNLATNKSEL